MKFDFQPIKDLAIDTLVVGYSGGLDSTLLLAMLQQQIASLRLPLSLRAIHINHGLSNNATQWSEHCARFCTSLDIPFSSIPVQLDLTIGDSVEAQARDARYHAFSQSINDNELLVTAHHQDDQVETLLLQLIRGAGVAGCAAMPICKPLYHFYHWRPMLNFTRAQCLARANTMGLSWIEDESNHDTRFDRNFLRQKMIPQLMQRWPAIKSTISRSTQHFAEAQQLLDELAHTDLKHCAFYYDVGPLTFYTLEINALQQLSRARQKNCIRHWLQQQAIPQPNSAKLEAILDCVINAKVDAMPAVIWQNVEVSRYQHYLFVHPVYCNDNLAVHYLWNGQQALDLHGAFNQLKMDNCHSEDMALTVRFRQGGEKLIFPGLDGRKSLKNAFQEWGVPSWLRAHWPLIYQGEELLCVPSYYYYSQNKNIQSALLTITLA